MKIVSIIAAMILSINFSFAQSTVKKENIKVAMQKFSRLLLKPAMIHRISLLIIPLMKNYMVAANTIERKILKKL